MTVSKDKDDIVVSCKAEGYKPKAVKIVSSASAAGVTGVLLDFGITDMITGAMYKYPDSHNIALEKDKWSGLRQPFSNLTKMQLNP